MQNSISPCPLKMQVYHNYTICKTGGLVNTPSIPINFLTVTIVAMVR
jgi:hypothetical protein